MQATNIWPGTQYAFKANSGRSERFSLDCHRVKVIRKRRPVNDKSKRSLTQIDVQFLDRDTGEDIDYTPAWMDQAVIKKNEDGTCTVRSYDIIEFWEQVDDLYNHLKKKKVEAEAEAKRLAEERRLQYEQQERERLARLEEANRLRIERTNNVYDFLTDAGVKPEWITRIDLYNNSVILNIIEIEKAMVNKTRPLSLFEKAMSS